MQDWQMLNEANESERKVYAVNENSATDMASFE